MKFIQHSLWLAVAAAAGLASVATAQTVVLNNTNTDLGSLFTSPGNDMAETFSTGSASGDISELVVSLNFGSATTTGVYLYDSSGGIPTTPYESLQIGTVSLGDSLGENAYGQNLYAVELDAGVVAANPLAADTDYAISVEGQGPDAGLGWYYAATDAGATGTGSFLGTEYVTYGNWVTTDSQVNGLELELSPAPEPGTWTLGVLGAGIWLAAARRRRVVTR